MEGGKSLTFLRFQFISPALLSFSPCCFLLLSVNIGAGLVAARGIGMVYAFSRLKRSPHDDSLAFPLANMW